MGAPAACAADPAVSGFNCTFKIGGTTVGYARNVDPTFSADEQDTTSRANNGWRDSKHGLKVLRMNIETLWVPTAAGVTALEAAWFSGNEVTFEVVDENSEGWDGCCRIFEFHPGPQDLDNAFMCSFVAVSRGEVRQLPVGS